MIIPRSQDAIHKARLYRLLMKIADDAFLMKYLRFKGGTCAAMLGRLNRFSVDLDFDLCAEKSQILPVKKRLERHFATLSLSVKDKSSEGVQYFLKYAAPPDKRNTIKLDSHFPPPASNIYEPTYFPDIDRTIPCHTIETMFANKLVTVLDRWKTHQSIAGRDIYDIHYFFLQGYRYRTAVIKERRNTTVVQFFQELIGFINTHVTSTIIQQDLNSLLPNDIFQPIRKTLKIETLSLLQDELQRLIG